MSEYEDFIIKTNYGLILVDKDEDKRFDEYGSILFYHYVGYIEQPTQEDINSVWEELNDSNQFQYDNINELTIIEAPKYVVEYFKNFTDDE